MEANVKLAIEILKEAGYDTATLKLRATSFIDDEEKMRDYFKLTKNEFLMSYHYLTETEYELTTNEIQSLIRRTRIDLFDIPISEHSLNIEEYNFHWHEITNVKEFEIICMYYGIALHDIGLEWEDECKYYCFEVADDRDVRGSYVCSFNDCFEETNNFFRHFGYELAKI